MAITFDSAPDPQGYFTRLNIEPATATILSIQLCNPGVKFTFPLLEPTPLFTIQFVKYDLQTNQLIKGRDAQGRDILDMVSYYLPVPDANASPPFAVTVDSPPPNWIVWDNVHARPDLRLPTPDPPRSFSPIKVKLFLSAPNQAEDGGWIDLDLAFSFPPELMSAPDSFAWQPTLIFPLFRFDVDMAQADGTPISDWSVLFPRDNLGQIKDFKQSHVQDMRMQFAALYNTGADQVRGIALSATDTLGHEKSFNYSHPDSPETPTADSLHCHFTAPMHLNSFEQYVPPVVSDDSQFQFKLSEGDEFGFGGASMRYRIKAFHVEKTHDGAALDWMDVANIYRKWVKANRPDWFKKTFSRPAKPAGPMDTMSPHTVITNYGLDGPLDPGASDPQLARWLEIHPIKVNEMPGNETDVPDNSNESLQDMLRRMRARVDPDQRVKLEAQIWGYEVGGYYHYIGGYPPITNVMHLGGLDRFKVAMDELFGNGIVLILTTDLLKQQMNGGRYRGHLIRKEGSSWSQIADANTWRNAIPHPFPGAYTDFVHNPNACKFVTATNLYDPPYTGSVPGANNTNFVALDRVFIVRQVVGRFYPQPNCPEAETLAASRLYDEGGRVAVGVDGLGNPFYDQTHLTICPTLGVPDLYLDSQVRHGAFKHGARLLEFMKTRHRGCYFKGHQHVFGNPPSDYTNVIGLGCYAVARLKSVLSNIQDQGRLIDANFALTHEGPPPEPLLPYINEFYHSAPVFHFVYSEAISAKMSIGGVEPYIHPGYREKRRLVNGQEPTDVARPDWMLRAEADDYAMPPDLVVPPPPDPPGFVVPPYPEPKRMPEPNIVRTQSFDTWRIACANYFNEYFEVDEYGIAPKSYPTGPRDLSTLEVPWNQANPTHRTNPPTYTYIRCIQDMFNLRYWIMLTGAKAVVGERVFLHANWFEPPLDYNEEAVKMAVRAAQLQMSFAPIFGRGYMLGKATITGGNKLLWAWKANYRWFDDVTPLVAHVTPPSADAPSQRILDFLSLGTDKEYLDKYRIFATVARFDKIQHMIWQLGEDVTRRVLYVFANVGNTGANVQFRYSRGLEGISSRSGWKRATTIISEAGVQKLTQPVSLGLSENLKMPPRSVAGIEIRKETNPA